MSVGDYNVEQVTAFMCNLTSEYGNNPTETQAESFARREKTIITPEEAKKILGVRNWEDVVVFYKKEILKIGPGVKRGKSHEDYVRYKRYTDEELLEELKILWQEFGGKITQPMLIERAKRRRTPSWGTLKRLGKPEDWKYLVRGKSPP